MAIVRFTPELSRWEPEQFVRTVLVEWLHVAEVWVGGNFLFGRERSGNFSLLRSLGARYGFRVEKIDPVRYKDFVVSSTRVRRLVSEGRVDEAGALMGHYHFIDGVVVHGYERGRKIGFPTANLATENELFPPHGVYATTVTIDGIIRRSITNIGVRPTFDGPGDVSVETHIFDFDRDIYGTRLRLAFVQRMRAERAFPDVGGAGRADSGRLPAGAGAVRPDVALGRDPGRTAAAIDAARGFQRAATSAIDNRPNHHGVWRLGRAGFRGPASK